MRFGAARHDGPDHELDQARREPAYRHRLRGVERDVADIRAGVKVVPAERIQPIRDRENEHSAVRVMFPAAWTLSQCRSMQTQRKASSTMGEDDRIALLRAAAMRACTSEFVDRLTARKRLPFDYSVASLRLVDLVVDGLRHDQPQRDRVAGTLLGLGAYTGEVIVRRAGGTWIDLDASYRELFRQTVGIRMPDERVWNPLGKVVNRFEGGTEESVQRFYLLLHGRSPRQEAACC
jgi:hypothetical protein